MLIMNMGKRLLAAVEAGRATIIKEITVDLSAPLEDEPLDLGDIQTITAWAVKDLTDGAAVTVAMDGNPVTVAAGENRDRLQGEALTVTTEGGTDWAMVLEIHGRA